MAQANIGGRGMPKTNELYDRDFFLWTQEQAAALRAVKNSNLPLDWANLAEEIESLGKSERRQLRAQIGRNLRHLLRLEVSPALDPRAAGARRLPIADRRSRTCCTIVPVFDVRS